MTRQPRTLDRHPIDADGRLLRAARNRQLEEHFAKQLAEIARDTDSIQPERFTSKLPGDERALRGIPAIGRGVTGAIPGTRPGHVVDILGPQLGARRRARAAELLAEYGS